MCQRKFSLLQKYLEKLFSHFNGKLKKLLWVREFGEIFGYFLEKIDEKNNFLGIEPRSKDEENLKFYAANKT